MQNGILSKIRTYEYDGKVFSDASMWHLLDLYDYILCLAGSSRDGEVSTLVASSSSGICCDDQSQNSAEQLVKAKNMGIFELSPVDEVEGELIFYQHRLLSNAVARKSSSGLFCLFLFFLTHFLKATWKLGITDTSTKEVYSYWIRIRYLLLRIGCRYFPDTLSDTYFYISIINKKLLNYRYSWVCVGYLVSRIR